ncbi:hypothetical protein BG418_13555 [Streptomyces sp. CBMA152]|nr:hypothetical protein [Streptomyces sp. CBMA152]
MHRPVLEKGQDRRADIPAPGPSPRTAPATTAGPERSAAEAWTEGTESGTPPLEVAPTAMVGSVLSAPMSM